MGVLIRRFLPQLWHLHLCVSVEFPPPMDTLLTLPCLISSVVFGTAFAFVTDCQLARLAVGPRGSLLSSWQVRTMPSRNFQKFTKCLLLLACGLLFSACGGDGDGGGESGAWIRIDSPVEGTSTSETTVRLNGLVGFDDCRDVTGLVMWSNGEYSGSIQPRFGFPLVCSEYFETEVPLSLGSNTITVTYGGARASVTVSRFPLFSVGGKVIQNGPLVGLRDIAITLTGIPMRTGQSVSGTFRTDDTGGYVFPHVEAGTYTLVPSLSPPHSSTCFSFAPSSRTINVTTVGVYQQDFTATTLSPCYSISGRVAPSSNPTGGAGECNGLPYRHKRRPASCIYRCCWHVCLFLSGSWNLYDYARKLPAVFLLRLIHPAFSHDTYHEC